MYFPPATLKYVCLNIIRFALCVNSDLFVSAKQSITFWTPLDIAGGDSRINPNGGAIAIGHPLGASGARLALTAARQLKRTHGRYALVTLCIGVGQGLAMILERGN